MPYSKTLLILGGLALTAPALAQPVPQQGPGGMMRDPFGEATILRAQAEAQASDRFAKLDTNADGALSPEELAAARPAGANPPTSGRPGRGAGRMARMMDANGDGKITKDEFLRGSLRRFDMMDADHDGKLTKAERQEFMDQMRARMEAMRALGGGNGGGGNGGGDGPATPGD